MTCRRTSILVLGVCIGTFLLLFDVAAEVTESSAISERSDSQGASAPQAVTAKSLTKDPSTFRNRSASGKDERNVNATEQKARDGKDETHDSISSDESASKDEEEVDRSVSHNTSRDGNTHVTRSSEETDSSSSNADGNRKPRYGEIIAKDSEKGSNAKVSPEDFLRLAKTNELGTAKLALNETKQDNKRNLGNATVQGRSSSGHEGTSNINKIALPGSRDKAAIVDERLSTNIVKNPESKYKEMILKNYTLSQESSVNHEEKKNVTVNGKEITTIKSVEGLSLTALQSTSQDAVKIDEKKDKTAKPDHKEIVWNGESKKDRNATSSDPGLTEDREDTESGKLKERDPEPTTVRGVQRKDSPKSRNNASNSGTMASEAFDLEKVDEKEHEGPISLANDTYVNYNHFHNTLPEKDLKAGKKDPKEEVEIVKNVTHHPILKIVATNDTAKSDSHLSEPSNEKEVVYIKKKDEPDAKGEVRQEEKVHFLTSNATIEGTKSTEERKSTRVPLSRMKLLETTTQSVGADASEQTSTTSQVIPNPVPQGRTIEFSGINEFPNIEVKSTAVTKGTNGSETTSVTASSRTNFTERMDQRPYPYLKSSGDPHQVITEASLKLESEVSDVTEETSAYENTIGRGETEKKFVVTEPSVVIENSIQQQKPDEKNIRGSTNSTTESHSLTLATVISNTSSEVQPTNGTLPESTEAKAVEIKDSRTDKNDVPDVKGEQEAIAGRDEGYDVTGNGITEVSLTLEADGQGDKMVKSRSNEATASPTLRSTETLNASKIFPPSTDVQMEPEEAMMIRSTLVITESTIIPLDKDAATETNKSTTSTSSDVGIGTMIVKQAPQNSTEQTPKSNVTLHISSNTNRTTELSSTTLNPGEASISTTTSVEYEFVGLSETVTSGSNATVGNVEQGQTLEEQTTPSKITVVATTPDSFAKNGTTESQITATKSEEFTDELPTAVEDGIPTTDQISIMDNETEIRITPRVTQSVNDEKSNRTEYTKGDITTSAMDFAGDDTEDPLQPKGSSLDVGNVTEIPASSVTELLPSSNVTIMHTTMNVAKDSSSPFATSTLEPRFHWNTSGFTDSPEEETTESILTLSSDEITLLVKIIVEGTSHEVCPRLQDLRTALADVLTSGTNKHVLPKQIIIHQSPCLEPSSSSPTPMDISLTSILVYVIDEEGKFDSAMTKILPNLYKLLSANFPVRIHKLLLIQEADSGNAIAVVVVSSVAFICLVLLAGLLFIMRKRQTRFNYGERCRPVSLDAYSLDSVSAYNSVRRKGAARSSKRSYGNPTFEDSSAIPSHPLNFAGLSSFCNDINAINEEFSGIPQVSAKIDELLPGAEVKNRYANVIPLPETRVPLQRLNNDALTEYINASYVRGPKNATKYYIACQAPIDSTVTDFWRMIWEQQCKVIIMLTDLVENGVEKCTEYIPPSEVTDCHRLYGDYQVTLKKRETKEKYAISTLHLKNLENNTFREVYHIWYLWPVNGVQSDGAGLIAVLLEARALQRGGPGPIVVHCSPGTGRTGTLIALDLGIRQYEITRTVDVPRVVYTIRRDRAGAVQTKEQYAFIYKALNLYATKLAGGVLEST